MDWDKLKIFHTVAEASSFTKASTILNLSQSAISRQIQALESDLKVQLFERHARGLVLTENGEYLYKSAHEIISKLKSMTYKRQQELATDLLKQYFRDNPQSQVHTTQPNRIKVANSSLPPNSSWRNTDDMDLIPTNVDEIVAQTQQQHNMQLLPPDNNTSEQIYGNLNTVNPPNSSNFLSQPNRYNDKNIEFYKADGSSKNDSFLLCILAFLIFVLFERLSCIIKHS